MDDWTGWDTYTPDSETYTEQGGSAYETGYGAGSPGYEWSGSEAEGGWAEAPTQPEWSASEAEPTQADQMRALYPEWTPGTSYYNYLQELSAINPYLPEWAQIYGGVNQIPSYIDMSKGWVEHLYGGYEGVPSSLLMSPEAGAGAYQQLAQRQGKTYEQAMKLGGAFEGGLVFNPYTGNWVPLEQLYHMTSPPDIAAMMSRGGDYEFNPFSGDWDLTWDAYVKGQGGYPPQRQAYYPWTGVMPEVPELPPLNPGDPLYEAFWPFRVPKRNPVEWRYMY